jgi:hypothetical protein
MTEDQQILLNRLSQAELDFRGSKYQKRVEEALDCYQRGAYARVGQILSRLPSSERLLESLVLKLKGKSVHKTLVRLAKGKTSSVHESLKGLFSLGTHISIELEQGNLEYKVLAKDVHSRIGKILYGGE